MVKRYDFYSSRNYVSFAHRDEDENGRYVAYEDYAHLEELILEYKEVAKAAIEYREETQVNICEGDFLDRALESVGMFGEADNG